METLKNLFNLVKAFWIDFFHEGKNHDCRNHEKVPLHAHLPSVIIPLDKMPKKSKNSLLGRAGGIHGDFKKSLQFSQGLLDRLFQRGQEGDAEA